ncbi:hypothetical protein [Aeromonas hydrophila]|uniref:hypothetical protein n=1 Tax=Aeromonas hydrophila TaxID=644 RepID=UPI0035B8DFD7
MDKMWTLTKNKKAAIASGLCKSLILMVPEAGIEPARRERRGILNLIQPYEKTSTYIKIKELVNQ